MKGWAGRALLAALDLLQSLRERRKRRAMERAAETAEDLEAIRQMADAIERGDLQAQARIARARRKR